MRASRCRPGSPAGPSTSPAEPRPSETCATFPGAAAAAQFAASASSLALTAWWSWQLASLNFKPAFDPGCRHGERPPAHPPANSWLEPRWHQQPHSIRTLSKQHIHTPSSTPATLQTAYPHSASHTSNFNIYQQNNLLGKTSHRGTGLSHGPPELSLSLSQFVYMSSSLLVMISFFFFGSISIKQAGGLCRAQDRKAIQWGIETIYQVQVISVNWDVCHRAQRIIKDHTHLSHSLFTLLPSRKTYRSIRCLTARLQISFAPQAVRLFNLSPTLHCVKWLRQSVNMAGHQTGTENTVWDQRMPVWRQGIQYSGDLWWLWSGLWPWVSEDRRGVKGQRTKYWTSLTGRKTVSRQNIFTSYPLNGGFILTEPEVIVERHTDDVFVFVTVSRSPSNLNFTLRCIGSQKHPIFFSKTSK